VHPGEVLREDYLLPLGMSVKERRAVTADTAMRLARRFGGDAGWWLALQAQFDLKHGPHGPTQD
jgi:antitoxin HigA-1